MSFKGLLTDFGLVVTKLTKGNGQNQAKELLFRGKSKEVNTVPVPAVSAGMYRIGMYTGIETSTFHTGTEKCFFFFFSKFCNF